MLQDLTFFILDPEKPAHTLRPELLELASILKDTGPKLAVDYEDISEGESRTSNGLAISPKMAAMCIEDYTRTIKFIRGTYAAILDIRERYPDRPARILYIGCGPYAALAVPLMSIFTATQVEFTLLDVHLISTEAVKIVLDGLNLADRVAEVKTMDASSYIIPPDHPPDIILMEVMQACLEAEPQVAIVRHLLPQAAGAILVPEEVRIDLVLVNPSAEFSLDMSAENEDGLKRDRIPLGPVFVLNRKSVDYWKDSGNVRLAGEMVQLPDYPTEQYQAMLFTTISVYKNHVLRDYDSGLSCPRLLQIEAVIRAGDSIQFYYELGQHPALKAECLRSSLQVD